jgi:hypothetical protein
MNDNERYANFYLSLGIVMGTLTDKAFCLLVAQAIKARDVNPTYVRLVRDKLTQALVDSGEESAE